MITLVANLAPVFQGLFRVRRVLIRILVLLLVLVAVPFAVVAVVAVVGVDAENGVVAIAVVFGLRRVLA